MSRLETRFAQLREAGRTALVPYVTAGDPHPDVTVPLMHAMVEAGADVIELGVPFSDPMADGPVIQRATERALQHKVSLRQVLHMLSEFRQRDQDTPVVLMGYLNPVEIMGYGEFAEAASAAGADGVLTVDLPPEEADGLLSQLRPKQLDAIFLLSPTSTAARMQIICEQASGFVYYVSVKGITGSSALDTDAVAAKLGEIRQHTQLPIGVGFGIKDATSAAAVSGFADAVIVGSALIDRVEANQSDPAALTASVVELLASMRSAMDA